MIACRSAKVTPKKEGQFVMFWKRKPNGPIEPFNESDNIDFLVVNTQKGQRTGQFVFPKSILIKKGIISTAKKEGKRAFRVYSNWDLPSNTQAERTQKWQSDYFYEINVSTSVKQVAELYRVER